jgi:hypothetical protein
VIVVHFDIKEAVKLQGYHKSSQVSGITTRLDHH